MSFVIPKGMVDAAPVQAYLVDLRQRDEAWLMHLRLWLIVPFGGRAAFVTQLESIAAGNQGWVEEKLALAILGEVDDGVARASRALEVVRATGAYRFLLALKLQGWSNELVAAGAEVGINSVVALASGRQTTVSLEVYRRLAVFYWGHWNVKSSTARRRLTAKSKVYDLPEAEVVRLEETQGVHRPWVEYVYEAGLPYSVNDLLDQATGDRAAQLRILHHEGMVLADVGQMFGVVPSTVRDWARDLGFAFPVQRPRDEVWKVG